jgi:heme-degrading monooxygenase HmoA
LPQDRAEEAVARFGEAIAEIKQMEGLHEVYLLVNGDAGRAVTLAVWESHQAADVSRVTASRLRNEAAHAVDGGVISVEEYQVAIHEVASSESQAAASY